MSEDLGSGLPHRLWALVAARAEATPEVVLLADDRGREMTAAGFRHAAERAAAGLAGLGVGTGTRVMWQLPTCLEAVVLSAALSRLGAVQNPLITMLREAEIRALDEQFHPEFAVVPTTWRGFDHAAVVEAISGPGTRVLVCDHREAPDGGLALPQGDPATLPQPPSADDEVRWIYTTSGSTAGPKGVRHTDASVWAAADATVLQCGVTADDVFPMAFPYAHIGGVAFLLTSLRTGCRTVLFDSFDPVATPIAMAAHGATVLGSATPFFLAYLAAQRAHGAGRLFDRLRVCMGGGAPVAPDLDGRLRAELGGAGVLNGYGLTEFPVAGYPDIDDEEARASSSWVPVPGIELRIVGVDGRECAPGEAGELRLRGPQRFAGYLRPELDAAAFDELGYVCTGDLAVRDERGRVTITGRLKEIVVRNGENISVAEVETVLATHPAIADVAVVGLPDARHGERCCAVVAVAEGAAAPGLADIAAYCHAAGLARYKAPEQVEILPAIPRNAMGKVQRPQLRELLAGRPATEEVPG